MFCSCKRQHNTRLHGSGHVGFVLRAGNRLKTTSRWSCRLAELQHAVWSGGVWVRLLQVSSSGTKYFCRRAESDTNNTASFHQMFVILTFTCLKIVLVDDLWHVHLFLYPTRNKALLLSCDSAICPQTVALYLLITWDLSECVWLFSWFPDSFPVCFHNSFRVLTINTTLDERLCQSTERFEGAAIKVFNKDTL